MNSLQKNANESWKIWLADNWKALLGVIVLGLLPFLPVLLSGKVLFASDQAGSPGWRFYFDALRHGEIPLWNPFAHGGMPTFDAMFGDASYPFFILLGFLLPVTHVITWNFVLHVLIAGVSAYILARRYFRLDRWLAVALAVAYMLNTNFISHIFSGHTAKFFIISWLPLSLYFLLRSLGPNASWRHLLGLSLSVALFISTSHLQFTYYVLMGYFLVWLYFFIPAGRAKRLGEAGSLAIRFWVPILLGIGMVFFIFYPPIEYTNHFGIRGTGIKKTYEYATSWSMHPEETASLLVPEFGGLNENYWGRNYFKLNSEYPGITVWFLALVGLFAFRSRWYWFWSCVGGLAIFYGLGADTPVFKLFYETVPGLKNFRAPSMILFWLAAALLMMSGETLRKFSVIGEDSIPEEKRRRILKKLRITGFSLTGILAICGLFPDLPFSIWDGMVDASQIPNFQRQMMAKPGFAFGALRAAALVGLLTWAAAAFLLKTRRPLAFGIAAILAATVDLYTVNSGFIKGTPPAPVNERDAAVSQLLADTSHYRVFGLGTPYESWTMSYNGIEVIEGRADNELRHYRRFRGDDYVENPNWMTGLHQNPDGTVSGSPFLDLLNVKYLAYRVQNDPGLKLARNASVLPRAFFVSQWEAVSDSESLHGMKSPGFDPRRIAYVTAEGISSGGTAADSTAITIPATESVRKNNHRSYDIDAPSEGVLVMSEIWFPNWRVKVDGVPALLLRADFAFRGVLLKPGRHTVEFEYHSPWIQRGLWVSFGSLVALLLFLWSFNRFRRDPVNT